MAVNKQVFTSLLFLLTIALFGQEKLSIEFEEISIYEALAQLDQNITQQLSYNPQILPAKKTITQTFEEQSPAFILREILGTSYQLKNIGNYLIIQRSLTLKTEKNTFQIKGGIKDATSGEELADVSIYEINSLKSTLSDENGEFNLQAAIGLEEATFVISKQFYQDTIIRISQANLQSQPIILKKEVSHKKSSLIREKVKQYSSGLSKFFTSIELRKNAQNVNFVDTRLFQLSLVPSIGTNRKLSSQIKNKISLNLISGYSYGVRGVELGGVYNLNREEVRGVQLGGFGNTVGGEVKGMQVGGFINTTEDYVKGVQMAGFINVASDSVEGFQAAGFTNHTKEMTGFQVGGFGNHVKKMSGFQLAGAYNKAEEMDGFQLAGVVNIAREVRGLQLSVVNIVDTVASGVPFGVINIVKKNGFFSPTLESTDVIPYGFSLKMGIEKFYSFLAIGTNPTNYWSLGGGFGSKRFTSPKQTFFLNPELRWLNLTDGRMRENEDSNLLGLNFNLGYQFFKRLSISGGPSVNFFFTNHLDENNEPILNISNARVRGGERSGNRYQWWVGYVLSVGF